MCAPIPIPILDRLKLHALNHIIYRWMCVHINEWNNEAGDAGLCRYVLYSRGYT